eukprot:10377317-Lingulodinium_polyedra.AAC.1
MANPMANSWPVREQFHKQCVANAWPTHGHGQTMSNLTNTSRPMHGQCVTNRDPPPVKGIGDVPDLPWR